MKDKKAIRKKILEWRNSLHSDDVHSASSAIQAKLEKLESFKQASNILFYYTHKNEVDTIPLIEKYSDVKTLSLPVLTEAQSLIPCKVENLKNLKRNREGIPEPKNNSSEQLELTVDMVIVPGVAFDKMGGRIGMGKGYYDRYFSENKESIRVGLAFQEQVLASIPKESYDESVDVLITEKNIYHFDRKNS